VVLTTEAGEAFQAEAEEVVSEASAAAALVVAVQVEAGKKRQKNRLA
jgi:hypothetical protein